MTENALIQLGGFLGLCTRAGQVVFGQDACVEAVRKGTAAAVLIEEDASSNTRKRIWNTCQTHVTPIYGVSEESIGQYTGKYGCKVAAVKRGGMGSKILSILSQEPGYTITDSSGN